MVQRYYIALLLLKHEKKDSKAFNRTCGWHQSQRAICRVRLTHAIQYCMKTKRVAAKWEQLIKLSVFLESGMIKGLHQRCSWVTTLTAIIGRKSQWNIKMGIQAVLESFGLDIVLQVLEFFLTLKRHTNSRRNLLNRNKEMSNSL